jgi:hypothetical protein
LIAHGIQMAKDKLGTSEERAEEALSPGFMPHDEQRKATGFEVYTFPENHKQLRSCYPQLGSHNNCARCTSHAERDGEVGWYHIDGRGEDEPNRRVHKMPLPWAEKANGDRIHNVPATRWGCSICKVYLCKACFRMEDEHGKPHPDAWDHRASSRGVMARCVAVE